MSYKSSINAATRVFYVSTAGNDSESGLSLENALQTITKAIANVNALIPISSLVDPTAIIVEGAGTFFEAGLVFPDACQVSALDAVVTPLSGDPFEPGSFSNTVMLVVGSIADNSTAVLINNSDSYGLEALQVLTIGANSIGVHLTGTATQGLVNLAQLSVGGVGSVGHLDETDNPDPEVFRCSFITLGANDTCGYKHNPSLSTTVGIANIGAIIANNGVTGTKGFEVQGGKVDAFIDSIVADDAIIVESGAELSIICTSIVGDITVNAGGVLHCTITKHVSGTIINNGEIHGRIDDKFFGDFEAKDNIIVDGQIKIVGGIPGAGKILTSDADGLATWETGGGSETLAETLALGNTTGGTDLSISAGDSIIAPDAVGDNDSGEPIQLLAGTGGATTGTGGSIDLVSGSAQGTNQDSGTIALSAGNPGSGGNAGPILMQRFTGGSVGIGVALAPVTSALLEMISITKGFLKPRMTTAQRNAISSPATGLEIYNTTTDVPEHYNGSAWAGTAGNETLAETLVNGNITGGTDIIVSGGDAIRSPAGATDTNGDELRLDSGDGDGAGNGGSLNLIAGNGGITGVGGEASLISGSGGSTSGIGGSTTIAGGVALGGNEDGGFVIIDGGSGNGAGDVGPVVLQAESGGNVGIGTFTPSALLDVVGTVALETARFADGSMQDTGSTPDGIGWHTSTLAIGSSFSLNTEDNLPLTIFVRADGLKLYMTGNETGDIFEYDMSETWDVTTLVFLQTHVINQPAPRGLYFKPDGTKFYVTRFTGAVTEWTMSTPWDVTTASQTGTFASTSDVQGIWMSPDGRRLYSIGDGTALRQFDLSTAWDLDTASNPSISVTVAEGSAVSFRDDGRLMYVMGTAITEYELSTPWDITTLNLIETSATGLAPISEVIFNPDGTKFFALEPNTDLVHEFNLGIKTDNIITDGLLSTDNVKIKADTNATVQFSITDDADADQVSIIYNDATGESDLLALSNLTIGSVEGTLDLLSASDTNGSNISITSGDGSAGNGGDIDLSSGDGAGAGGTLNVTAGDGAFGGGALNIKSGNVSGSGVAGTVTLLGGVSGGASSGGQVHLFGGIGGDSDGDGGQVLIHAGSGGSTDGDGALLSLEGGQGASGGNTDGGNVDIQGGQNFGTGTHGDVLLQRDGGMVNIGIGNPTRLLDISATDASYMVVSDDSQERFLVGYTEGESFNGGVEDNVTQTQIFADTNGNLHIASRSNNPSSVRFYTNLGTTAEERMRISAAGVVTIGGLVASIVAPTSIEITTSADLDDLATGGVITFSESTTLVINGFITTPHRFVINGGTLKFDGYDIRAGLQYSGTDTFVSGTGGLRTAAVDLFSSSTGTLLDLVKPMGAFFLANFQNTFFLGWTSMGSVVGTSLIVRNCSYAFIADGFDITNATLGLLSCDYLATSVQTDGGAFYRLNGLGGDIDVGSQSNALAPGASFFRIDPGVDNIRRININNNPFTADSLFDTTGGTTGTFFNVIDESIALTTIDSVTDSSGVARFNFTVGPTVYVHQEIDISNFSTETSYNQTGIITAVGAGFFEVSSIAFTADDATGDFSGNSVELDEVGTTLLEGDTVVIDTTSGTQYDGGATVYNVTASTYQINRTFVISRAGVWDTAGIDQTDPRVLTSNNPGFASSKYIAAAFVNNNSTANPAIVNNTFSDMDFGNLIDGSNMERWKLINPVLGIFEYTGNEPFDGFLSYDFTSTSSGSAQEFRFKFLKDTGSGFAILPDNVESLVDVGSTASSISKSQPLTANKGDQIKPQVTRNSGTGTITTTYASINAVSG